MFCKCVISSVPSPERINYCITDYLREKKEAKRRCGRKRKQRGSRRELSAGGGWGWGRGKGASFRSLLPEHRPFESLPLLRLLTTDTLGVRFSSHFTEEAEALGVWSDPEPGVRPRLGDGRTLAHGLPSGKRVFLFEKNEQYRPGWCPLSMS